MCTTVAVKNAGASLLGQNYDFYFGQGLVSLNPRRLKKYSLAEAPEPTIEWVSKYGSVSFNQFGCEFPAGGLNEKGLAVAMMFDEDGSLAPEGQSGGLSELQWVQYQLDNFASVAEVKAHLNRTMPFKVVYALHYSVADSMGNSLIVEFANGTAVIHENPEYHVLTNSSYLKSMNFHESGNQSPEDYGEEAYISMVRFDHVLGKLLQAGGQKTDVSFMFALLEQALFEKNKGKAAETAFARGRQSKNQAFTFWTIVYDTAQRAVYFKTKKSPEIKILYLDKLDFGGKAAVLDINTPEKGDLSGRLEPFSTAANLALVQKSYALMDLPADVAAVVADYPATFEQV